MISIPVDPSNIFMAKQEKYSWVFPTVITILLGAIGILLFVIWTDQSDRFKSLDTTISIISVSQKSQGELLVRLDERTKSLERVVYETKATSLGFKKPEIVRTGLGIRGERKIVQLMANFAEKGIDVRGLVVRANSPIRFILPNGGLYADGYEATMLPDICAVIIVSSFSSCLIVPDRSSKGKRNLVLSYPVRPFFLSTTQAVSDMSPV